MRLQKYLAHAGICSRRKAEEYILNGRIKVNGEIITQLGTSVDVEKDLVLFDHTPVILKPAEKKLYILLNKPAGYVTTCSQENEKIILDLIDVEHRVYPVGRLDKDSQGLVLLTNDGELHNRLSHPSFDHEKEYKVSTVYPISDSALEKMANGMMIDKTRTRKADVKRLSKNSFIIVLRQGLNRQIRKMVGKVGNQVAKLQRIRMANLTLGTLKEGHWRYLTPEEIQKLTQ
ncbi:MAG: rRNA pseudouridine synthase [Proteobacteria bacterium]|nr:rRNA pseudouridine synthase [Pseudomonadota bacterium]MBU1386578.1 rRNA pseudouridine synthase [Pseudomonadota bacterium]MBU1542479.1 rRNA pseudouridine synthase [Pseudomonadota bacterium]MBU2480578.1 rRNA pseudouridine synthase [Pseudomonadota bacterium]